jgi:hypothetical protein
VPAVALNHITAECVVPITAAKACQESGDGLQRRSGAMDVPRAAHTAITICGHPKGLEDLKVTSMGKFHTKLSSLLSEEDDT